VNEELLEEQAVAVLASLDGASPEALRMLAAALDVAEWGGAGHLYGPIHYLSGNRARGEPPDWLTVLAAKSALRMLALQPHGAFMSRLEGAETAFWRSVRGAILALNE